jgi:regulator of replication initiation timing
MGALPMPEIISSISSAIAIVKKLKDVGDKIKDADFKMLLADLNLELAEIKMQLAGVMEENTRLKAKISDLESVEGEKCPKCHKQGWQIESSQRDELFGQAGGIRRFYKCTLCGFSEDYLLTK